MLCEICNTDEAVEEHHVLPKSKGGRHLETISCCSDCGGQVHMLFNNNELASMTLENLINHDKMVRYVLWKSKHPGSHKHRMSKEVKKWKQGHRQ
jgi:5-methylcytosine-specific restriction enzyme A